MSITSSFNVGSTCELVPVMCGVKGALAWRCTQQLI